MDQIKIGKFIGCLRKEKNLTQEDLAEIMGVTAKSISRWKNGKTIPDISIINILASELGVSVQELLNGRRMNKEELLELKGTLENLIEYESDRRVRRNGKTNKYIIIGDIILVIALLNNVFEVLDIFMSKNAVEFMSGFLFSFGLNLNLCGVYNNSHTISVCERKKKLLRKIRK